jgi:hypothetical protein
VVRGWPRRSALVARQGLSSERAVPSYPAALTLAETAPNAARDATGECELEALAPDGAPATDGLGGLGRLAAIGEPLDGRELGTQRVVLPPLVGAVLGQVMIVGGLLAAMAIQRLIDLRVLLIPSDLTTEAIDTGSRTPGSRGR